ncbi:MULTISPECIES: TetR/AcrR family transcriptional regulator [unclassified Microbacterium]|uniref:TetR/AcrR family transcriptional regulator n=1 Tax=unclassified Microbacterium TaxID=2609290 RepID=UPI001AD4C4EB|nr:TetR/AcrR family transcriptional regulator [Microbacterium sp.]MBN9158844.1 TetR/AcrR family transcriptional regulator [Microbacterium sp.]MBS1898838.1 TetR/AcrR family transcriptional regulator [Actinomycetota bacterium]MBS1901934.1 TetR/AcrR family transcriptional regulator [Actinomycetota bacterium]
MPKISAERKQERRAEIIAAAMRCFGRTGYQRTSMADIIAESGLSAGAIYGYFAGKQELLEAVAGTVLGERIAEIGVESDGGIAPRSPRELALMTIRGLRQIPTLPLLVQTWGEAVTDPELRILVGRLFPEVRQVFVRSMTRWRRAQPDPAPADPEEWAEGMALLIVGLVQGAAVQSALLEDFDAERYLRAIGDTLPG